MSKLLDQSLAWILGILFASMIIGGGLYSVRYLGKRLIDNQLLEILDVDNEGGETELQPASTEEVVREESKVASLPPKGVNVCEAGSEQSPIDVKESSASLMRGNLNINFGDGPIYYQPGDESSGFVVGAGVMTLAIGDENFSVERIDVRSPSEHRLEGARFDAELIFYSRDKSNRRLNMSVWLRIGLEANSFLGRLNLAADGGDEVRFQRSDLFAAIPEGKQYFEYRGSMIDPPCDEGVTWLLMKQPVIISSPQLDNVKAWSYHSKRKLQPLGTRKLRLSRR